MKKAATLLIVFISSITISLAQNFKAGDKVEAWNVAWYKATILQVGAGDRQGYYMVHYDDFGSASDQWLKNTSIRARASSKEASTTAGPRLGKYNVLTYGSVTNPIRLGYFVLSDGNKYSFYDNGGNIVGSGTYSYDDNAKSIKWQSGPFKQNNWEGNFAISREGKTHSITLKRGTVGSNSTDSK